MPLPEAVGPSVFLAGSIEMGHAELWQVVLETALADLDAVVEWSEALGRHLLVGPEFTMVLNWNHLAAVERA